MKPEAKERLDRLLHDRGLFDSRQKARRAIEAGAVCVDGKVLLKPGMNVGIESEIAILMETERYVGRGGLKLEEAIHLFDMDFKDRVVLDAGASTGGFTHCALLHGARLVHAVDVGHGQLDARLAKDPRVLSREGTDIRTLPLESLIPAPDIVLADLSFISLASTLPALIAFVPANGSIVCLLKPQFEAGREAVGKGGIVRDGSTHRRVLGQTLELLAGLGCICSGVAPSPIRGGDGNAEYLIKAERRLDLTPEECGILSRNVLESVDSVVRRALETPRP
jgi:23S rRNA (cytidine1920-2'-O)/16S rRNA (cytidine1409-2'-O)-methyltransferase